jgi:hypothetical protein
MQRNLLFPVLVLSLLAWAVPGHALFEVRAHYGAGKGSPDAYNSAYFDQQDGPELGETKVLGADVLVSPPMLGLGLGLRFEGMTEEASAFAEDVEVAITRLSLLANYRLVDTLMYFGPIVSVGLSHKFEVLIPTGPDTISSDGATSFSAGVEGGVKLGLFRVGAEVGYQMLKFKDLTEADGSPWTKNGQTISEFDLSGMYYKVILGVGF